MRAIDIVRRLCPRAKTAYISAFEAGDPILAEYGVTTPLRLAHFLSQVLHESGGLTIERESGSYSAKRIVEIFGVGKHSAAITAAEAKRLAGDGPSLFERVYGLGNPRKAKELGNTKKGDGWAYRGNGLMQTTGRGAHLRLGQRLGLGDLFEREPAQVTVAQYALLPALAEWKESNCNALADKNDIVAITRKINGGTNGLADRKSWFAKVYPLLKDGAAWQEASPDDETRALQESLSELGYDLKIDGLAGPATEKAVKDFQGKNGLKVDGIAGELTRAKIAARLAGHSADDDPPAVVPLPSGGALTSGTVQGGLGVVAASAGGVVMVAREVKETVDDARGSLDGTAIGLAFFGVFLVGGLLVIWNRYREAGKLPRWLGGQAVSA